jgi:hypothetical protein
VRTAQNGFHALTSTAIPSITLNPSSASLSLEYTAALSCPIHYWNVVAACLKILLYGALLSAWIGANNHTSAFKFNNLKN